MIRFLKRKENFSKSIISEAKKSCPDGKPGPWSTKIYERLTSIQTGDAEDVYGWNLIL